MITLGVTNVLVATDYNPRPSAPAATYNFQVRIFNLDTEGIRKTLVTQGRDGFEVVSAVSVQVDGKQKVMVFLQKTR